MANRFTPKNIFHTDRLIYVAPVLLFVSLFHLFKAEDLTRNFGQMEVIAALMVVIYYLWDKIAELYPPEIVTKKRIEGMSCVVVGLLLFIIPLPPLMTWQYYNLYKKTDGKSYTRPIVIAILCVWAAVGLWVGSSYAHLADQMAAQQNAAPAAESSYVAPTGASQ